MDFLGLPELPASLSCLEHDIFSLLDDISVVKRVEIGRDRYETCSRDMSVYRRALGCPDRESLMVFFGIPVSPIPGTSTRIVYKTCYDF